MSDARKAAFGGVLSALSLVLLAMSAFMPITYIWVMLSGFVIMIIAVEIGRMTAFLAYFAVSSLCFMLLPNIVIIMQFSLLLGWYPILKTWLDDTIVHTLVRIPIKLVIFICFAVTSLFIASHILGATVLWGRGLEQAGFLLAIPIAQSMIFCIAYDYLLDSFHDRYLTTLRPRIFTR